MNVYHVYLLRSIKNPQMTYVGFTTKDIRERMDEHNRSLTRTTAPHVPWNIEVLVSFADKSKAQEFEIYLKHGSGYAFAKRHFWSTAKLSAMRSFAEHSAEKSNSAGLEKQNRWEEHWAA